MHRSLPCRLIRCTFIRGKYLVLIVGSLRFFGATSHGSTGVEGPTLYGNHPVNRRRCFGVCHTVSGEYGAFELTAFCLACRRQRLFCHYCHQCAWCTSAAWSQPAIERVEMQPQRVWEGESSEDEDYTDDNFRVTAEFAFAAAGMGMSWQIRRRGRVVHD